MHATTILAVRREPHVALGGDGQVTLNSSLIVKHGATKIRRLYQGRVIVGFAGSVADAFTLLGKFESKLEEYRGNLLRSAVELAKDWRLSRELRQLEAMMLTADREKLLLVSGTGEVIEPDDGIAAIGSGGAYALAAARALARHTSMPAGTIVRRAMEIAAEICVYTNTNITIEELEV